jgi:hypothetical protein
LQQTGILILPGLVSGGVSQRTNDQSGWFKYTQTPLEITQEQTTVEKQQQTELEAAAFRRLVSHLQSRTDVQNIDLMNLAGFCRNCLSKWYAEEAGKRDIAVVLEDAREQVYGMPYAEWKSKYQTEATAEQKALYKETHG